MYFSLWEVKCKIVWNAPWSAIQIVLKCIIIFSWIHFREKKSKRKQEIICTIETDKSINILKYNTLSRKTQWWAKHYTSLIIIISKRVMVKIYIIYSILYQLLYVRNWRDLFLHLLFIIWQNWQFWLHIEITRNISFAIDAFVNYHGHKDWSSTFDG